MTTTPIAINLIILTGGSLLDSLGSSIYKYQLPCHQPESLSCPACTIGLGFTGCFVTEFIIDSHERGRGRGGAFTNRDARSSIQIGDGGKSAGIGSFEDDDGEARLYDGGSEWLYTPNASPL